MNNFNVTINIQDLICSNNCKDKETITKTITNTTQSVKLKENYILNVVNVSNNYFTVIIQNGKYIIIRNVFTSHSISICIPCKCATHIITISGTINNV